MNENKQSRYVEVAVQVLTELGGGPISTKTLYTKARELELVGDGKWVYHALTRNVRASDTFDTSRRGYVSFGKNPCKEIDIADLDDDLRPEALAEMEVINPPQFNEPGDLGPIGAQEERPALVNPFGHEAQNPFPIDE